jgi:hypothetical protein
MASLIPFFKEKQLRPVWSFDAGALIWRIFFTSNHLIIGETRNQEEKTTRFFCLDIQSGKPLWQNIGFDEPWWIGIEAIHEKWLVLHGYVRPDMPEHRGMRVVDIDSGEFLWRNDNLSYWFIHDNRLFAHKYVFEKHICSELEIKTGTVLNEQSENLDLLRDLRQQALQKESERHQDVMFPEVYDAHEAEPHLSAIIQRITGNNALEGWIEYLEHNGRIIVSYYLQKKDKSDAALLNNFLAVYDGKSEKTIFNEIIAEEVRTPSPDSFFVKDDLLLFIKHQTTLLALNPWKL